MIIPPENQLRVAKDEEEEKKKRECRMNRHNAANISDKLVFIGPHCPRRRVMSTVIVKVIKKSLAINAHLGARANPVVSSLLLVSHIIFSHIFSPFLVQTIPLDLRKFALLRDPRERKKKKMGRKVKCVEAICRHLPLFSDVKKG